MRESLGLHLLRRIYTVLLWLFMPLLLGRLALRGMDQRELRSRWRERLGSIPDPGLDGAIWLHAVSVGETNAAAPLVAALRQRYPQRPLVVTSITATGSARVRALWGDSVFHAYLPYDLPGAVGRFLDRIRPALGVVMETEIWPNLYRACAERGVPLVIANARLSERSLRGYGPLRPLARAALGSVSRVAAQSLADAERLVALGAAPQRLRVTGNLKYHQGVPEGLVAAALAWRSAWGAQRPVWIAASTHEREEPGMLQAHALLREIYPDALLMWAPRHPERFPLVIEAARDAGLRVACRSRDLMPDTDTQCFVIDTLGELMQFLPAADVAFVGGSLQPIGGHNMMEPASLGVPTLVGPHNFNFVEAHGMLSAEGALRTVPDVGALAGELIILMGDPMLRRQMGEAGKRVVELQRGALSRTMALVEELLPAAVDQTDPGT